jgi:hypothetical protein
MSLLVYLDTNIFNHLIKKTGGITQTDEKRLRAAVSSRQLTILISQTNIREALAALESHANLARALLSLIIELADWDRFLPLCPEILEGTSGILPSMASGLILSLSRTLPASKQYCIA